MTKDKMHGIKLNLRIRLLLALMSEFKRTFFLLGLVIFGGGALIHQGKGLSYSDAMLAAFAASFFEIIINTPFPWFVQIFLYLAPLIGLFVLADSIAKIITLLSGHRQKQQTWWVMVASTYRDHIVVCGVGKVGYRIINELRKMGQQVVGVELDLERTYVQELIEEGVPIIHGNVRLKSVHEKAQVQHARAVICVTSDDMTNLDCAFTARELKNDLRVVIRVFDDTIAKNISSQFDLPAISTSYASAPSFVSEALELDIPQSQLTVYGHAARVNSLLVNAKFDGKTVAQVEESEHIKILGYRTKEGAEHFPAPQQLLTKGGQLIILQRER